MHAHARRAFRVGGGLAVVVAAMLATPQTASAEPARGNSAEAHAAHKKQDAPAAAETPPGPPAPAAPLTEPQPLSGADDNGSGANQRGPYDSTRDGSPSKNGEGGGEAKGRPCAGCVGKADNKNPKGQLPGPQDKNNGYECDGNHGIAKGNPAHTGCVPDDDPPPDDPPPDDPPPDDPPPDDPPPDDPPPDDPPPDDPPPDDPPPDDPPGVDDVDDDEPVETGVESVFIPVADSSALPQTGAGGVLPLGAAGLGLLLAGAGLRTVGLRKGRASR